MPMRKRWLWRVNGSSRRFLELRRVAQQTVVSTLADDPAAAVRWIGHSEASLHVPLLEVVLGRISADQLPSFLDQAADLMVQQEYHGSALLSGFSPRHRTGLAAVDLPARRIDRIGGVPKSGALRQSGRAR